GSTMTSAPTWTAARICASINSALAARPPIAGSTWQHAILTMVEEYGNPAIRGGRHGLTGFRRRHGHGSNVADCVIETPCGEMRFVSTLHLQSQLYSASKRWIDRSTSPLTARAAAAPIGPNIGLPPRSSLKVNLQPEAVGETVIISAYLVPPTPSPVISSRRGGSISRTVHVTRLRKPLAPATPTSVAPVVSSAGTSPRHPWCITNQSPRSARFDACAHASSGVSDSSRDSSSLATCRC